MILRLPIKNQNERMRYYNWITETGISCIWEYVVDEGNDYMIIELGREDAVVFRLKFGYDIYSV